MGDDLRQYEWTAIACSDLLEIATRLTAEEFKLYFIVLALVKRTQGRPGSTFNSVAASHRQLRHWYGPIALRRLGKLLAALERKRFVLVMPQPGKPSEFVMDTHDGPVPARFSLAERPSSLSGGQALIPRGLSRAARATSLAEAVRGLPSSPSPAADLPGQLGLPACFPKEKGSTKEKGEGSSSREAIRSRSRSRRLPPKGELPEAPGRGVPPLFLGLTALLLDRGFVAHVGEVQVEFDRIEKPADRRRAACSMNSLLLSRGGSRVRNWGAFANAYVTRRLRHEPKVLSHQGGEQVSASRRADVGKRPAPARNDREV